MTTVIYNYRNSDYTGLTAGTKLKMVYIYRHSNQSDTMMTLLYNYRNNDHKWSIIKSTLTIELYYIYTMMTLLIITRIMITSGLQLKVHRP